MSGNAANTQPPINEPVGASPTDDEGSLAELSMFTTPMRRGNEEPWGIPYNGQASTQYPVSFPPQIKELIEMVPLQEGLIGQDLRPMLVEVVSSSFSDVELEDIAAMLSIMQREVLEEIAPLIAYIVKKCWMASPGAEAHLGDIILSDPSKRGDTVTAWMEVMQDLGGRQLEGLTSRPFTFWDMDDMIFEYARIMVQPSPQERLRFVIDDNDWQEIFNADLIYGDEFDADDSLLEVFERVKDYIDSLPVVPEQQLDSTDKCGICLEAYYQEGSSSMADHRELRYSTALKLPCGHVFCARCLRDWLTTTSDRHNEDGNLVYIGDTTCPMCRAPIDVWDEEVPTST